MGRFTPIVLALSLFVTGCGERMVFNSDDVDQIVVDAYLIVDQALPPIWVSRTSEPRVPATPENVGEVGATVRIVDEDGNEFLYADGMRLEGELLAPRGRYLPLVPDGADPVDFIVRPGVRYDLTIVTARDETVRATTIAPPRLDVDEWLVLDFGLNVLSEIRDFEEVGDSVYTIADNQLEWGASLLEARFDRDPSVPSYQVALFSLDPDSDFAIEPDFFEEEDFDEIDREGASPMFDAEDGTIRLPWFAVFFEGRYKIKIYATDQNWRDFVTTVPSLSGNGGFGQNAGDGFDRPIFRIDGGIGLFGSASVDSVGFFVFDDD